MAKYGFPYMGSKSAIADKIISVLPFGNRFVDLFGGGFAMSHCAILLGKFKSVLYNEINKLNVDLVSAAIAGKYSYDVFKPEFVTREHFFAEKEDDGYIKYIWSFGNDGQTYLFGRDIEHKKHALHNAVVFGNMKDVVKIDPIFHNIEGDTIKDRRLSVKKLIRLNKASRCDLERLEQLERLERLEQLERLERIENIDLHCGSYLDYQYKTGDVVYCDPPYENTRSYSKGGFNHKEFYNWVHTRDFPVYFSSYKASGFNVLASFKKRALIRKTQNNPDDILFGNDLALEEFKQCLGGWLKQISEI